MRRWHRSTRWVGHWERPARTMAGAAPRPTGPDANHDVDRPAPLPAATLRRGRGGRQSLPPRTRRPRRRPTHPSAFVDGRRAGDRRGCHRGGDRHGDYDVASPRPGPARRSARRDLRGRGASGGPAGRRTGGAVGATRTRRPRQGRGRAAFGSSDREAGRSIEAAGSGRSDAARPARARRARGDGRSARPSPRTPSGVSGRYRRCGDRRASPRRARR